MLPTVYRHWGVQFCMLDAVRELTRNYELQQKEVVRLFLISKRDRKSFHLLVFLEFLCLSCNGWQATTVLAWWC